MNAVIPIGNLPADYVSLLATYGRGKIDDFLFVLVPNDPNPNLDLVTQARLQESALDELRKGSSEGAPLSHYVRRELIPWGLTDNGDICFWNTGSREPNRWTVVVADGRMSDWDEFAGSMTEYLAAILGKRIRSSIFPDDWPSRAPRFEPIPYES